MLSVARLLAVLLIQVPQKRPLRVFDDAAVLTETSEYAVTSSIVQSLPPIMTTDEVAALLRCSTASVARYVFAHQLAAIQIGRQRRFRADDVLDFISSRPLTARTSKSHFRQCREGAKSRSGGSESATK